MKLINAKYLRNNLEGIAKSVKDEGIEYGVLYRSKLAFRILPPSENNEQLPNTEWRKLWKPVKFKGEIVPPEKEKELLQKWYLERYERKRKTEDIS